MTKTEALMTMVVEQRTYKDAIFKAFAAPWSKANQAGHCRDVADKDVFLPNTAEELRAAQAVCADCPITRYCLSVGQARGDSGVYGGQFLLKGRPAVIQDRWPTYY